ncbi:MAG: response regulator [Minisyncoccia bacterium]
MESYEIPKKILIVDDDKFLLDMYTYKFKEKGFDVIQAFGSLDAYDKLKKEGITPDVMLLDVVMPAMDGFELLTLIKSENLAPNAKVVMLSNLGQPSDIERGRSLGAKGYVVKASATPTEVVEKVLIVLGGEESFAKVD